MASKSPFASTGSTYRRDLAKLIIRDAFGETAEVVTQTLLIRGRSSIKDISESSGLSFEEIKAALTLLCWHRLVLVTQRTTSTTPSAGATSHGSAFGFLAKPKASRTHTRYEVYLDAVLMRLHFPAFLSIFAADHTTLNTELFTAQRLSLLARVQRVLSLSGVMATLGLSKAAGKRKRGDEVRETFGADYAKVSALAARMMEDVLTHSRLSFKAWILLQVDTVNAGPLNLGVGDGNGKHGATRGAIPQTIRDAALVMSDESLGEPGLYTAEQRDAQRELVIAECVWAAMTDENWFGFVREEDYSTNITNTDLDPDSTTPDAPRQQALWARWASFSHRHFGSAVLSKVVDGDEHTAEDVMSHKLSNYTLGDWTPSLESSSTFTRPPMANSGVFRAIEGPSGGASEPTVGSKRSAAGDGSRAQKRSRVDQAGSAAAGGGSDGSDGSVEVSWEVLDKNVGWPVMHEPGRAMPVAAIYARFVRALGSKALIEHVQLRMAATLTANPKAGELLPKLMWALFHEFPLDIPVTQASLDSIAYKGKQADDYVEWINRRWDYAPTPVARVTVKQAVEVLTLVSRVMDDVIGPVDAGGASSNDTISPNSSTYWGLNLFQLARRTRTAALRSVIVSKYDLVTWRLFAILLRRRRQDQSQLGEAALISMKETRERLYALKQAGYVSVQSISRSSESDRKHYLWSVEDASLYAAVVDAFERATYNLVVARGLNFSASKSKQLVRDFGGATLWTESEDAEGEAIRRDLCDYYVRLAHLDGSISSLVAGTAIFQWL